MPQAIDHPDLLKSNSVFSELEGSSHPDTSSSSLVFKPDTGDKSERGNCHDYSTDEAEPAVGDGS